MELQGMDRGVTPARWRPRVRLAGVSDQARSDWLTPAFSHICGQCLAADMCGDGGVVRFPSISEPSVLSVLDVHPAPLRGGWTSRAIRTLTQAVASRSQCRQLRHQTTSSRYRTTRPAYPLVTPVSTRKALRRLGGDRSVKRHLRQGTSTSRLRRGAAGSSTACLRGGDWRVASEDRTAAMPSAARRLI